MATIDVKDAGGATVAIEKPLTPGRKSAALSRPTVWSDEDLAAINALGTLIGPLNAASETDPDAASATLLALMRGFIDILTTVNTHLDQIEMAAEDTSPVSVSLGAALPAGTANIGDVDVLTLPALPAGTNAIGKLAANSGVDIGDVDVTSLPALAAGTNSIGAVTGWGFDVAVTAATSTFATPYSAGDIMGALLTFSNVSRANDELIMITGIQIASKVAVAPVFTLILFGADPTSTTKTDNANYTLNAADAFSVRRAVTGFTIIDHGTPNTFFVGNLNIVMAPAAGTRTIYALLIDGTGVTLGSATDIQVRITGVGV